MKLTITKALLKNLLTEALKFPIYPNLCFKNNKIHYFGNQMPFFCFYQNGGFFHYCTLKNYIFKNKNRFTYKCNQKNDGLIRLQQQTC
jgi:hypothetical protein